MNSTFGRFLATNSFFLNIVEESNNFLESFNSETASSIYIITKLFFHFFYFLCFLLKLYKFLCYLKMTIEWFPMINPFSWPFSFIRNLTIPYFRWWSRVLPAIKFKKASIDISAIISLEALNAISHVCINLVNLLVLIMIEMKQNI
jgi:uncharacterized protein YggT (Ycf19 family)